MGRANYAPECRENPAKNASITTDHGGMYAIVRSPQPARVLPVGSECSCSFVHEHWLGWEMTSRRAGGEVSVRNLPTKNPQSSLCERAEPPASGLMLPCRVSGKV